MEGEDDDYDPFAPVKLQDRPTVIADKQPTSASDPLARRDKEGNISQEAQPSPKVEAPARVRRHFGEKAPEVEHRLPDAPTNGHERRRFKEQGATVRTGFDDSAQPAGRTIQESEPPRRRFAEAGVIRSNEEQDRSRDDEKPVEPPKKAPQGVVLQGGQQSSLAGILSQYEDDEPDEEEPPSSLAGEQGKDLQGQEAQKEQEKDRPRHRREPEKHHRERITEQDHHHRRARTPPDRHRDGRGRDRGYGRDDSLRSREHKRRTPERDHEKRRSYRREDDRDRYRDERRSPSKGKRHEGSRSTSPQAKRSRVSGFSAPVPAESAADEGQVDISSAVDAAKKAASLVNTSVSFANQALMQKRKLLWGAKKAAEQDKAGGLNRWDAAQFQSEEEKQRFNKFMGLKGEGATSPPAAAKESPAQVTSVLTGDRQRELQQNLEKQYTAGLRRKDGRTVGLGL